uniref:Uncharacterized protein n=1 Tax=Lactuca sativa TaxID=4236 RepID=A0A9R1V4S2_LACSA|nr:hypothetical protein LSAT_V11C600328230 [Lactuca sativa]
MLTLNVGQVASNICLATESNLATASPIAKGNLLTLFGIESRPELENKLKYTQEICSGVILGKELINALANVLNPVDATYSDVLTAKILDIEQCK